MLRRAGRLIPWSGVAGRGSAARYLRCYFCVLTSLLIRTPSRTLPLNGAGARRPDTGTICSERVVPVTRKHPRSHAIAAATMLSRTINC
jgi:hypothetical protein